MHYTLENPYFLLLLPLLLCLFYCKKRTKTTYLPRLDWIPKTSRLFNTQTLLKVAIFSLLVLTLASPISYDAITPSKKYGRDIVLALDTSGSMRETGFSQQHKGTSKFELLQTLVADFIQKRVSDNIGVVAFGSFAFSASPVTYDHQSLKELLSMLEVEIAGKNTAIGDAINQSLTTLSFSHAKEKIIILITDGISNAGTHSIQDAVAKAKAQHVKIFTIGLGKHKDFDAKLLTRISQESFGKSFEAKDAQSLKAIYEEIDSLIPSAIRSEQYLDKKALFTLPLFVAILLLFTLLARQKGLI
jgi:Ca-activated chloride channel family protein